MKRLILIVMSVIILASLLAWRFHLKSQQSQMQAKGALARKNAPASVTVASAAIREIKRTYEAVGSIESPYDVKLAAQTTGRIIYLQAREGDHVTRGEVLVRIDPSLIESQIAQRSRSSSGKGTTCAGCNHYKCESFDNI